MSETNYYAQSAQQAHEAIVEIGMAFRSDRVAREIGRAIREIPSWPKVSDERAEILKAIEKALQEAYWEE